MGDRVGSSPTSRTNFGLPYWSKQQGQATRLVLFCLLLLVTLPFFCGLLKMHKSFHRKRSPPSRGRQKDDQWLPLHCCGIKVGEKQRQSLSHASVPAPFTQRSHGRSKPLPYGLRGLEFGEVYCFDYSFHRKRSPSLKREAKGRPQVATTVFRNQDN